MKYELTNDTIESLVGRSRMPTATTNNGVMRIFMFECNFCLFRLCTLTNGVLCGANICPYQT